MTADELAERLREAHPDAEPDELDPDTLTTWIRDVGVDADDDALIARVVVAWSHLIA
jgi:hypothetical protein